MSRRQYKILVIPGASDGHGGVLDLDVEIGLLVEISERYGAISVDVIPVEQATEVGIASRLSLDGITYDAAHWLGHADDNGFYLPDGAQLSQERIQRICVDAGARMVFLNSCESGRIGQYLVNNKIAVALSYAVPVMDKDGILNSLRFYTALARSTDPFEDGLREAYTAADPGDGSLLWLTNGEYVKQIIRPIVERLDQMHKQHDSSFGKFNQSISTTKNVVQNIDKRLSGQIARLMSNTRHTRYALISLIAIILISAFALGWLISSVRVSSAHVLVTATVEEPVIPTPHLTPTWTPRPTPTRTRNGTIPPTAANVPPTATRTPTHRPPTSTRSFTPTRRSTATKTPAPTRRRPTNTPWPTVEVPVIPTATATLTDFEKAVSDAVEATIAARGCGCQ